MLLLSSCCYVCDSHGCSLVCLGPSAGILLPGAFSSTQNGGEDAVCAADANAFLQYAQGDGRVDGLVPWHWLNLGSDQGYPQYNIGTQNAPQTRAAWTAIGQQQCQHK